MNSTAIAPLGRPARMTERADPTRFTPSARHRSRRARKAVFQIQLNPFHMTPLNMAQATAIQTPTLSLLAS